MSIPWTISREQKQKSPASHEGPGPTAQEQRRVLVIHPGALGDVLLARPALSRLRRLCPQHEMMLLAGSAVGRLLQEGAEVDRVLPLESTFLTELFGGSDRMSPAFQKWLRRSL